MGIIKILMFTKLFCLAAIAAVSAAER